MSLFNEVSVLRTNQKMRMKRPSLAELKQCAHVFHNTTFPLPPILFDAWVENFPTVAIELAIVKKNSHGEMRVLMIKRPSNDKHWPGLWHMPGTVLRQNESIHGALSRIVQNELGGARVPYPTFKSVHEFLKGRGQCECVRGHEIALLYKTRVLSGWKIKGGKFFREGDLVAGWPGHYKLKMVPFHLDMAISATRK